MRRRRTERMKKKNVKEKGKQGGKKPGEQREREQNAFWSLPVEGRLGDPCPQCLFCTVPRRIRSCNDSCSLRTLHRTVVLHVPGGRPRKPRTWHFNNNTWTISGTNPPPLSCLTKANQP